MSENFNVEPPKSNDNEYTKVKKLGITQENHYKYFVGNNGMVCRENAEFDEGCKNNYEDGLAEIVADGVTKKTGYYYFIDNDGDICSTNQEDVYEKWNDWQEQNAVFDKKAEYESQQALENELKEIEEKEAKRTLENIKHLKYSIIKLLKDKPIKMPTSDIDAFLKHQNVDEIKELCEEMYHNGDISRTSNYRYFILTEEKKKPKKVAVKKTGSVADEIKKFKELLDAGAITQEEYDAKKKELLGL